MTNNAQNWHPKCLISMEISIFGYSLISLQPANDDIMMQRRSKALKLATKFEYITLISYLKHLKVKISRYIYGNIKFLIIIHVFMLTKYRTHYDGIMFDTLTIPLYLRPRRVTPSLISIILHKILSLIH